MMRPQRSKQDCLQIEFIYIYMFVCVWGEGGGGGGEQQEKGVLKHVRETRNHQLIFRPILRYL